MRKLIITIILLLLAALLVWAMLAIFKKRAGTLTPKAEQPMITEPRVIEPPPDTTQDLLQDNLDQALEDITALE